MSIELVRRLDDVADRTTRSETQLDGIIVEVRKLRDRQHEMAQAIAPIVLAFDPEELTTVGTTLRQHMIQCDKRGARLEKAVWFLVAATVGVLGVLLKAFFHL